MIYSAHSEPQQQVLTECRWWQCMHTSCVHRAHGSTKMLYLEFAAEQCHCTCYRHCPWHCYCHDDTQMGWCTCLAARTPALHATKTIITVAACNMRAWPRPCRSVQDIQTWSFYAFIGTRLSRSCTEFWSSQDISHFEWQSSVKQPREQTIGKSFCDSCYQCKHVT